MSCDQDALVDPYFDGELDVPAAARFADHVRACAACRGTLERRQAVRTAIEAADLYAPASAALRARVKARTSGSRWRPPVWLASAAGLAAVLLIAVVVGRGPLAGHRDAESLLAAEVLDAHLRSLQLQRITDVPSTDQHTVKPWYVGKLDFSPPVVDLAPSGFPLLGGRLDVVGGRPVAAIVYARRKHVINVFVWPSDGREAPLRSRTERGYTSLSWTTRAMSFWAVSDLDPAELDAFARALQASAS